MKSEHHSFNVELAKKYGIIEAILIHHFQTWINVNIRKKSNKIDGRTWTYQTLEELKARFPYLGEDQIRYALDRLTKGKSRRQKGQGIPPVLVKGNHNQSKYDRTIWYAFVEEKEFTIDENSQIHSGFSPNQKVENTGPIPDTKTDTSLSNDKEREHSSSVDPSQRSTTDSLNPEALRLANLLLTGIQKKNPKFKPKKKDSIEIWSKDIEKINRIDGVDWKSIETMIAFATTNDFWVKVTLSGLKLREHSERFLMEINTSKKNLPMQPEIDLDFLIKTYKEKIDSLGITNLFYFDPEGNNLLIKLHFNGKNETHPFPVNSGLESHLRILIANLKRLKE